MVCAGKLGSAAAVDHAVASSAEQKEVRVEQKQSELICHSTGVEAACTDGFISS